MCATSDTKFVAICASAWPPAIHCYGARLVLLRVPPLKDWQKDAWNNAAGKGTTVNGGLPCQATPKPNPTTFRGCNPFFFSLSGVYSVLLFTNCCNMVHQSCGPLPLLFPYAKSETVVINFHCAWEDSFTNNYGIMGYDYGTNWYHNEDILKGYD